jgi:acetylornithine/succinyldiaminopimelate/putrescine aminotransferase
VSPAVAARLERGDLLPLVRVPPPGPASRALSERLAASEAPGANTLGPADEPAIVWAEALGANVLDVDGNVYVDLTSGFGVAAIGHRPAAVVAAVARQAGELLHGLGDVAAHRARVELAERLAALAPVDSPRVQFAISGAEAVEIALKTAIACGRAAGRGRIVVFDPGYHGLTLGALAATSRDEFRAPFVEHLSAHFLRLPFGAPVDTVDAALEGAAALLVEPLVGREGVLAPPRGWLAAIAARARSRGALFVADEIFTGFGRTGATFAVEDEGVRPDLLCCGKALGGGLPIAAVLGRSPLMEIWRRLPHGGEALHTATFLAHPLACAAALATLDEIVGRDLPARARGLGARIEAALAPACVAASVALRGRGALWGLELRDAARAKRFVARLRDRGVLVLAGGPEGRVAQVVPPLTIAEAPLEAALAAIRETLATFDGADGGEA